MPGRDDLDTDEFLDQAFATVRGRVAEDLRELESLRRHKIIPVGMPQTDEDALNLCEFVLHDLSLPNVTSTELVLATYLRSILVPMIRAKRPERWYPEDHG
jgi:hypothetical protein